MKIEPINFADFLLVEIRHKTPHCKKHGAMNKFTVNKDGGGIWRCTSLVTKQNDNACRAGCCETRKSIIEKIKQLVLKLKNPKLS